MYIRELPTMSDYDLYLVDDREEWEYLFRVTDDGLSCSWRTNAKHHEDNPPLEDIPEDVKDKVKTEAVLV